MKRSEINTLLAEGRDFFHANGFRLPPFAYFSPADWKRERKNAREIFDLALGWDVTDFGLGRYAETGLLLFTIRNGMDGGVYPKPYAEKIMLVKERQVTPLHFHFSKMEDIINRGGGFLVFSLYRSDANEGLSEEPVEIVMDGIRRNVAAGEKLALKPGESISLPQRLYHAFWAEGGPVMTGEVSAVNDDKTDNRFHEPVGRFPEIEEDADPLYLLCQDYGKFIN
jgi:D-lyxose ketol-isomerase